MKLHTGLFVVCYHGYRLVCIGAVENTVENNVLKTLQKLLIFSILDALKKQNKKWIHKWHIFLQFQNL